MKYVVYTEIHEDGKMQRWYYGEWDYETANRVAMYEVGDGYTSFGCVCKSEEAKKFGILNLPARFN